jgi:predicted MFS family arabinose efflux permease
MASNLAGALFNPAIMSLPIYAVEEPLVQNVTAMLDTCFSLGTVLGPALSALLYPWLGLRGLFLFNGLSYVFAAALESGIRVNPISLELAAALAGTTEVGHHFLRVLKKDALVRFMLVSFLAINLFLGPLTAFLPIIIQTEHHGSLRSLAQFETSIGIGTVCGGIFLSLAKWQAKTGVKILTSMAAMSLSYLCFALSHGMGAGCFLLACLGFTLALGNVTVLGLFQIRPAPEDVPTVMSLVNLISVASLPLAMTLSAILLQKIQLRLLDVAFGVILCLITAVTALNAELRRL